MRMVNYGVLRVYKLDSKNSRFQKVFNAYFHGLQGKHQLKGVEIGSLSGLSGVSGQDIEPSNVSTEGLIYYTEPLNVPSECFNVAFQKKKRPNEKKNVEDFFPIATIEEKKILSACSGQVDLALIIPNVSLI